MSIRALLLLLLAGGCAPARSATTSPAPAAAPGLTAATDAGPPAVARAPAATAALPPPRALAFLTGCWDGDATTERQVHEREAWLAVGQAVYSVRFIETATGTQLAAVRAARAREGELQLLAVAAGRTASVYALAELGQARVRFERRAGDGPRQVELRREQDQLLLIEDTTSVTLTRSNNCSAAELVAADADFASAVARRRLAGWVEAFAPAGAMWSEHEGRIEGAQGIRAAMADAFGDASFRLDWQPRGAALAPAGDLGLSVGTSQSLQVQADGATKELRHGTYVTVWQKGPDGRWRVLFDTGSTEN